MKRKLLLYMDQFGNHFYARSVKELRQQIGMGGSRVSRMYEDRKDEPPVHIGYIIGGHWLMMFEPVERPIRN